MKLEKTIIKCSCGRDIPTHWFEEGLMVQKPKAGKTYCVYCADKDEDIYHISANLRKNILSHFEIDR